MNDIWKELSDLIEDFNKIGFDNVADFEEVSLLFNSL